MAYWLILIMILFAILDYERSVLRICWNDVTSSSWLVNNLQWLTGSLFTALYYDTIDTVLKEADRQIDRQIAV